MIDHILGRPSIEFRKTQVAIVVSFWSLYLLRGDPNGPPLIRRLSKLLNTKLTSWQLTVLAFLFTYIARNFGKIVGLESPEPLANLYNKDFFRATWIMTALDAGFWSAMRIRQKWVRDIASIVFSVYYLFMTEQADEKVRKVRHCITVEHMRVSWNKPLTPYLRAASAILRPKFTKYEPRKLWIPRPAGSMFKEPVVAWLFFDGPLSKLAGYDKIVLDVPGGGFVAMTPRCNDDRLLAWAGKTGLPLLSLDYKKAPEYPYPYALNECFDVYKTLIQTKGKCAGLSGEKTPRIVLTGDSAGGNLASATTIMVLQTRIDPDGRNYRDENTLPAPESLILVYPGIDVNIGNWMSDEQMQLFNERKVRASSGEVVRRKSEDFYKLEPMTPTASDHEDDIKALHSLRTHHGHRHKSHHKHHHHHSHHKTSSNEQAISDTTPESSLARTSGLPDESGQSKGLTSTTPPTLSTRLAISSLMSYTNDRVLTPEMMRAMIILYVGPYNRPDFSTDFLLSPVLVPDSLLRHFPKTYIMTGERDPLVDDTIILSARIRKVKLQAWSESKRHTPAEFDERDHIEMTLIPGISHGFLSFPGIYPEGWKHIFRLARWITESFTLHEKRETLRRNMSGVLDDKDLPKRSQGRPLSLSGHRHHHRRQTGESSADEFSGGLEMTSVKTPVTARLTRTVTDESEAEMTATEDLRERMSRQKSFVSLPSNADLVGRRMKGLAGGLMGMSSLDDEDD